MGASSVLVVPEVCIRRFWSWAVATLAVITGLDPVIHVLLPCRSKDVDGRVSSAAMTSTEWMASRQKLKPRIPRLHRIAAAVEFAQVRQTAHRQPVRILFAGFDQLGEVVRHLGARLVAGGRAAIHQQIVGLHDAINRGLHGWLPREVR